MVKFLRFALVALLPACAYTDQGSGTNTLLTTIQMVYSPSTDTTSVVGTLQKDSLAVSNAELDFLNSDNSAGNITLYTTTGNIPNLTGSISHYPRHQQIKITADLDSLTCKLEGPGAHTLAAPLQDGTQSVGSDLPVQWQTSDGLFADQVIITLDTAGYTSPTLTNDSGTFTVPAAVLKQGKETVTVHRINQVIPAGGASPSSITMEYKTSVQILVQ